MSSNRVTLYALLIITIAACSSTHMDKPSDTIPEGARRLMAAYPDYVVGYEDNMIVFSDGTLMTYDDGKRRTICEMHIEQDVEDIFYQEYDKTILPPPYGYDPGRYRCAAFFEKIYGSTREEVMENLVYVDWCPSLGGEPLLFSKLAGAAEALQRVSNELEQHPELQAWVVNAQTFNWRTIHDMPRLSPHCYGIAIDLAVRQSHYWRWTYPRAKEHDTLKYYNTFEMKVVEIFERHGFIWGGRWYHFDTMHFEYRPEMNMPDYGITPQSKIITAKRVDPDIERELYFNVFKEHKEQ